MRELANKGIIGPTTRSYWIIENRLAAGAYPSEEKYTGSGPVPEPLDNLLKAGINLFINLTQDYLGGTDQHLAHYDSGLERQAQVVRYPIVDDDLPQDGVSEMVMILDRIDTALDDGENVYVHCWGGSGRTGMVVGCWLRRHGLVDSDTILERMQELRLGDREGWFKSTPNTLEQAEFIVGWSKNL
tara:strand:+ start:2209 stop:2766 length:558 start_codon:yes stop_codon:yes gene_type:complete